MANRSGLSGRRLQKITGRQIPMSKFPQTSCDRGIYYDLSVSIFLRCADEGPVNRGADNRTVAKGKINICKSTQVVC